MTTLEEAARKALEFAEAQCGGRCNAEYNPCHAYEIADCLRTALAQQGGAERLYDAIEECMIQHRMHNFLDEDGDGFPLVDHLSVGPSIEDGKHEIRLICDSIYNSVLKPFYTAAPAPQAQPDWLLKTTQDLANSIRRRCFPEVPQFQVLDDLAGVISQIDNMTCGMERKSAPQAQPVAQPLTLEQILDIVKKLDETPDMSHVDVLKTFARAIEAAHGIREVK